jgi:peptidyl-prolyl cis-trans isomerase C
MPYYRSSIKSTFSMTVTMVVCLGVVLLPAHALAQDQADKPVVTVNGEAITQSTVEAYRRARPDLNDVGDDMVLDELVKMELLYQQGLKQKLQQQAAVQADIEYQRRKIIARAVIADLLASTPIGEAELKAAYDARVQQMGGKEYKLSHIVVASKAEAEGIIQEIDNGADFAQLAQTRSVDPSGKASGGSLNWLNGSQLPEELLAAIADMNDDSYSTVPVKTRFGWHVVRLEQTRDLVPPPFESVKQQLESMLENRLINDYLGKLKNDAKITIP